MSYLALFCIIKLQSSIVFDGIWYNLLFRVGFIGLDVFRFGNEETTCLTFDITVVLSGMAVVFLAEICLLLCILSEDVLVISISQTLL